MTEKRMPSELVSKALESLQEVIKGHSSGPTPATKVESMRDGGVGAGSSAGATQVFHTPSNSDPGGWAGSTWKQVPENGATDSVDANGIDYKSAAAMMKSIIEKISKGQPLSAKEAAAYSQIAKGGFPFGKEDDKDEDKKKAKMDKAMDKDEDEDEKEEMGKSLADFASESEDVSKGLEISDFLTDWVNVQTRALEATSRKVVSSLSKSLDQVAERQESFNSDLAKSIVGLVEALALQAQRIEQLESTPARAPKATAAFVEKSFAGQSAHEGESLNKSQILETMVDMVHKGLLPTQEVVRFETTSNLSPELDHKVRAFRAGR